MCCYAYPFKRHMTVSSPEEFIAFQRRASAEKAGAAASKGRLRRTGGSQRKEMRGFVLVLHRARNGKHVGRVRLSAHTESVALVVSMPEAAGHLSERSGEGPMSGGRIRDDHEADPVHGSRRRDCRQVDLSSRSPPRAFPPAGYTAGWRPLLQIGKSPIAPWKTRLPASYVHGNPACVRSRAHDLHWLKAPFIVIRGALGEPSPNYQGRSAPESTGFRRIWISMARDLYLVILRFRVKDARRGDLLPRRQVLVIRTSAVSLARRSIPHRVPSSYSGICNKFGIFAVC